MVLRHEIGHLCETIDLYCPCLPWVDGVCTYLIPSWATVAIIDGRCRRFNWPTQEMFNAYTMTMFFWNYVIPPAFFFFAYSRIVGVIRRQSRFCTTAFATGSGRSSTGISKFPSTVHDHRSVAFVPKPSSIRPSFSARHRLSLYVVRAGSSERPKQVDRLQPATVLIIRQVAPAVVAVRNTTRARLTSFAPWSPLSSASSSAPSR